jgi:hypothetical protein
MFDEELLRVLNQYRAAELRGAKVILKLLGWADTDLLRSNLTRHFRDEGTHAWLWTQTITELGGEILDYEDPFQAVLGRKFGLPRSVDELLALTLITEERGLFEYEAQLERDAPDLVHRRLRRVLADERWHVSWIGTEVERRSAQDPVMTENVIRARQADAEAIAELRPMRGDS